MKTSFTTLICTTLIIANTLAAGVLPPGKIKVFQAKEEVDYVNHSTGESGQLKRGMDVAQNYSITTGEASRVLFIFSNGSRLNIGENTEIYITRFLQEPYDRGHFLTWKTDPSKSDTLVTLKHGTIAGKVQHLQADSKYIVETKSGSTFVGEGATTTYLVSHLKKEDGSYQTKYSNIQGNLKFISTVPINIPAGALIGIEKSQDGWYAEYFDGDEKYAVNKNRGPRR